MSDTTKIEWTDYTWSPWEGCTKVSPGCAHCYAETRNHRFGNDNWGRGKPRRLVVDWRKPVRWNAESAGRMEIGNQVINRTVFPSLCDPFDDEVPIEWFARFLKLIHDTPCLNWLLLTKRPENFRKRLGMVKATDDEFGAWLLGWFLAANRQYNAPDRFVAVPDNVWIGASVEDQIRADERIPELLKIPAARRFLSVEPLLGPVTLSLDNRNGPDLGHMAFIDWVIIGGESGVHSRQCKIEWIQDIVSQCRAAGVPPFVKQLGSLATCDNANVFDWPADARLLASDQVEGAASCLIKTRHPKGGDIEEWPDQLRVREFPNLRQFV